MPTEKKILLPRFDEAHALDKKRKDYGKDFASMVPEGVTAKVVIYIPGIATWAPGPRLLRQRHRDTWIRTPGVCSPKRHEEAGCVLFPVFFLNLWSPWNEVQQGPCEIANLSEAEYLAKEESLASNNSETVIIHVGLSVMDPRWKKGPWPLSKMLALHPARTRFVLRFVALQYPWFTHLVKQDLDNYIFWSTHMPMLVRPATHNASATGHVLLAYWYSRGHKARNDRCIGGHQGGCNWALLENNWSRPTTHLYKDKHGAKSLAAQFNVVINTWCNPQCEDPLRKYMDKLCETDPGLCSGFPQGASYGLSASLVRSVVRDGWLDMLPIRNEDVELSRQIHRIALNESEEVELRVMCDERLYFRHFR